MGESALQVIQQQVEQQGEIPVDLKLDYKVLPSSLSGNLPINNKISGELAGMPVDIEMGYTLIYGPHGSYPVNNSLSGTIGDSLVEANLPYKIVFASIAGNIPVNTGVEWTCEGRRESLETSYALVPAFARSGGGGSGGSKGGGLKLEIKYVRGVPTEVETMGGGSGPPCEAGRPLIQSLLGRVNGLEVDCRFQYTYYINASSGRNPVNTRLVGVIRKVI
ncbi:hypothetical protein GF373_01770 [bacterium]|nr:hypothetical protein [bacterium]